LSLTPDGVNAQAAPEVAAPKANRRTAAITQPAAVQPAQAAAVGSPLSVAPPAAAPAVSSGGSGGYVVQISAQNSEGEAQASFRAMQAKYPSQLGGRAPIIRKKETPSGIKYGAQVGPFGARAEALQLCEGLKAAGGSCFVQKN
jgi:cell division septation protein DedD